MAWLTYHSPLQRMLGLRNVNKSGKSQTQISENKTITKSKLRQEKTISSSEVRQEQTISSSELRQEKTGTNLKYRIRDNDTLNI